MFHSFRLTFLELTTYRGCAWIVRRISIHPARRFAQCLYFQRLLSLSFLNYRPHEALPRNTLSYVSWDQRQDPTQNHTARFIDVSVQSPFYLFREQKPRVFFKLFMTLIFFIFLTLDQFLRKMSLSLKCRIFPHSLNKISHGAGKPHHWRHVFLRMSRQEVCDEACTMINHIIWWSDSGGLC